MNVIKKALDEIRFEIPRQILVQAFTDPELVRYGSSISLDTLIREAVIDARVVPDCNLSGGVTTNIPLHGLTPEYTDITTLIYRIPKSLTQGRTITTALEVTIGDLSLLGNAALVAQSNSGLVTAAQGLLTANKPVYSPATAYVRLIGENTIMVSENYQLPTNLYLRCVLENDSAFSNLPASAYHDFAMLCKLATKAHIFNTLALSLDIGQMYSGMAMGRFKEIVDGYADANELYTTFLKDTWRKVAIFSDHEAKLRHLKQITGRGL